MQIFTSTYIFFFSYCLCAAPKPRSRASPHQSQGQRPLPWATFTGEMSLLPPIILDNVASYIEKINDIKTFACISQQCYWIARRYIWNNVFIRIGQNEESLNKFKATLEADPCLVYFIHNVAFENVAFEGFVNEEEAGTSKIIQWILNRLPTVRIISFRNFVLTDAFLQSTALKATSLKSLELRYCTIAKTTNLQSILRRIQDLTIRCCSFAGSEDVVHGIVELPQMRTLRISCPLRQIEFRNFSNIRRFCTSDQVIAENIKQSMSTVTDLELFFSDHSVFPISFVTLYEDIQRWPMLFPNVRNLTFSNPSESEPEMLHRIFYNFKDMPFRFRIARFLRWLIKFDNMDFLYGDENQLDDHSILTDAIMNNNRFIVNLLLNELHFSVNRCVNHDHDSPLIAAITRHDMHSEYYVKLLIDAGVNVNVNETMSLISSVHSPSILRLLIDAGLRIHDSIDNGHSNALHRFCSNPKLDPEMIWILINAGASIDAQNDEDLTPLMIAILNGFVSAVMILIDAGASLDLVDRPIGYTALHYAVLFGGSEILNLLIDNGAALNVQDNEGKTPLFHAAEIGDAISLQKLIHMGANIHIRDRNHRTPLSIARDMQWADDVIHLLEE